MVKTELIKRSPLRIFEKSIHGGIQKGEIGVITARKGVGKTACLVHIATDQLFQDKHVIHVSFSHRTDHIISWYEDIFEEISKKRNLESAMNVHDEIIKNRVIMNFSQEGIDVHQILKSLRSMMVDGNFKADQIVVDGYDFTKTNIEEFKKFKDFVTKNDIAIWFTASPLEGEPVLDENGIPRMLKPFIDELDIIISLTPQTGHIHLRLVKDHEIFCDGDMHLRLDAKSLLIAEDDGKPG